MKYFKVSPTILRNVSINFIILLSLSCFGSLKDDKEKVPIYTIEDIKKIVAEYAGKKEIDLEEYGVPKIEYISDAKYWGVFYRAKPVVMNNKEYFGIDDCFHIYIKDGNSEDIIFKACP
jgi:hypothetical protein